MRDHSIQTHDKQNRPNRKGTRQEIPPKRKSKRREPHTTQNCVKYLGVNIDEKLNY